MRKTLCLFLIVIFIPHLTACQSDKLLQTDSPHLLLTACVYYSVPGFYQSDLKGVRAGVVEVDDYGRTLVCFERHNYLTDKNECVYVICQRYSDSTIYFYENINYTWVSESIVDLENLKKLNDWNSEINESKFSFRRINVSFDLCLVNDRPFSSFSTDKFYLSLLDNHAITRDSVVSVTYCDWDNKNQVLYLLNLNDEEKYFCIVDEEYNTFVTKIENEYDLANEIIDLKHQSNWSCGS